MSFWDTISTFAGSDLGKAAIGLGTSYYAGNRAEKATQQSAQAQREAADLAFERALPWSTGGLFGAAAIFGVPFAAVNLTPLRIAPRTSLDLFIPKKYRYRDTQKFLTIREIIEIGAHDWGRTEKYTQAGLDVVENSSEEILDLVVEMNARLDGTWVEDDNDNELQSIYRSMFPKNHPIVGHPSRIGARFLSKNAWLLN